MFLNVASLKAGQNILWTLDVAKFKTIDVALQVQKYYPVS